MTNFQAFVNSSMDKKHRAVVWDHENADHRRAFATAIAPLVSVLWKKSEPFSRADAVIYMRTLKYVPTTILVEAVEKALEVETWFPEPAKLLNHAADLIEAKREAAWKKWIGDGQECEECHNSRWVTITLDGVERLTRCGCWNRAVAEMDAIGQPLKRKELPAANVEMV
jgi:hypothetical protein